MIQVITFLIFFIFNIGFFVITDKYFDSCHFLNPMWNFINIFIIPIRISSHETKFGRNVILFISIYITHVRTIYHFSHIICIFIDWSFILKKSFNITQELSFFPIKFYVFMRNLLQTTLKGKVQTIWKTEVFFGK